MVENQENHVEKEAFSEWRYLILSNSSIAIAVMITYPLQLGAQPQLCFMIYGTGFETDEIRKDLESIETPFFIFFWTIFIDHG